MNRKQLSKITTIGICLVAISTFIAGGFSIAQDSESATATVKQEDGMESVEFDTLTGTVTVDLPDDMSETDTISGSVIAEPKGETKEEVAQNEDTLQGYVVEIEETQEVQEPPEEKEPEKKSEPAKPAHPKQPISKAPPAKCPPTKPKCEPTVSIAPPEIHTVPHRRNNFSCYIPKNHKKVNVCIKNKNGYVIARKPLPCKATPPVKPTKCIIPPAGTCDAPLKIVGPCDGRSATSKVTCNDRPCYTLAESPRKQICKMPKNTPGKCVIKVTESGRTTTAVCMLAPAKTAVASAPPPSRPKVIPTPAAQPEVKKPMFRCTGPTVEGGGSYKENTMQLEHNKIMWLGHSVRDRPNDPLRASVLVFTPPPEIITVGDVITIQAKLTGSELFWGSGSFYSGSPWFKLHHDPRAGTIDQSHPSATLSYEVVDLYKYMEDYKRKEPEKARSFADPSTYPFEINLLGTGPHHPQVTLKWTYVPYTPPRDR